MSIPQVGGEEAAVGVEHDASLDAGLGIERAEDVLRNGPVAEGQCGRAVPADDVGDGGSFCARVRRKLKTSLAPKVTAATRSAVMVVNAMTTMSLRRIDASAKRVLTARPPSCDAGLTSGRAGGR